MYTHHHGVITKCLISVANPVSLYNLWYDAEQATILPSVIFHLQSSVYFPLYVHDIKSTM